MATKPIKTAADLARNKQFVKLETPKHPEMLSLEECAAFQPWKVDLHVLNDVGGSEPQHVNWTIFLRAPSPGDAQNTAFIVFEYLERTLQGIEDHELYPCVATGKENPSTAEALTEDQYMAFWAEAQFYPHMKVGMQKNPSIFRFVKPGWQDMDGGIIKPGSTSLIMPGRDAISKVTASKNRQ